MPEKIRPIGRGSRKPVGAIAVLAALIVAMAMLLAARTAMVLGQPPAPDAAIAPPDLRMAEGMVSGGFDNRPLFEILDALRSHANFEYEGDESSLNHPVSGMFDRVPLREAVKQVLEPTNYTMVFDATGMLRSLRIGSLRRRPEEAGARPEGAGRGVVVAEARAGPEPAGAERLLFEVAADGEGPPPGWLKDFEPRHDGNEETGPQVPVGTVGEDLPEFAPLVSEDGPFDPNAAGDHLPEFEPLISDTGPSLDGLEDDGLSPAVPR